MAQVSIINDLSNYTKVPAKVFDELALKTNLCIGSAIHDAIIAGEEAAVLNIGIGSLSINLQDMQCKFIPSKNLKATIKTSISNGVDPLELTVEQAFVEKLISICEEVI